LKQIHLYPGSVLPDQNERLAGSPYYQGPPMKPFKLLPLVALVVVALSCRDTTSPANSHALLAPRGANLGFRGEAPPPPADVAVTFTISSDVFSGPFNGVYFSNPAHIAAAVAAAEVGDQALTFDGTAWLRLDNSQPSAFGTSTSANARFQTSNGNLSGHGTIVIAGHVVHITEVTGFIANPDCLITGEICAAITFNATIDDLPGPHTGTAEAFNRESCEFIPEYDPGEGPPIPAHYNCGNSD
jgi:hypothetical protein